MKEKFKITKEDVKDLIMTAVFALALSTIILTFFRITYVKGHSMDGTLHDGQRLVLSKCNYWFGNTLERNDIVVFERKDLSTRYLIKRVVGIAGDHVVIKDNQLYINDELINEDYIKEPMITEDLDIVVPDGKVFCMGDNRNKSTDSRKFIIGYVDVNREVVGKVIGI